MRRAALATLLALGAVAVMAVPALASKTVNLPATFRSLQAIENLPVELVLVSHGEPVLEDGRCAIRLALG